MQGRDQKALSVSLLMPLTNQEHLLKCCCSRNVNIMDPNPVNQQHFKKWDKWFKTMIYVFTTSARWCFTLSSSFWWTEEEASVMIDETVTWPAVLPSDTSHLMSSEADVMKASRSCTVVDCGNWSCISFNVSAGSHGTVQRNDSRCHHKLSDWTKYECL